MRVRLLQAATVVLEHIGHHWHPAGAEVDIQAEHFDPQLHAKLSDDAAPSDPVPAVVFPPDSASEAPPEGAAPDSQAQ